MPDNEILEYIKNSIDDLRTDLRGVFSRIKEQEEKMIQMESFRKTMSAIVPAIIALIPILVAVCYFMFWLGQHSFAMGE